jgi:excisionase family DNA binding protein
MTKSSQNLAVPSPLSRVGWAQGLSNESWLTVQELMTYINISRDTVERLIKNGELHAINIAVNSKTNRATWRISSLALEEFIASRASRPPAPAKSTRRIRAQAVVEFIK